MGELRDLHSYIIDLKRKEKSQVAEIEYNKEVFQFNIKEVKEN